MSGEERRTVLLTGAGGRLGTALGDGLRDAGYAVLGLGRREDGKPPYIRWDLRDPDPDPARARELAAVTDLVHAAAIVDEPPPVGEAAMDLVRVNVTGTIHLLRHLPALRRVVFVSSVAVYGPPSVIPCTEDHPTRPTRLYGMSKVLTEHLLRLHATRTGTSLAVLRVASVYGFPDPALSGGAIGAFLRRCHDGLPVRLVRTAALLRDYIHVDDVVAAAIAVLASRAEGIFNVASGSGVSLLDVTRAAGAVAGRTPTVEIDPALEPDTDFVTDVTYDISRARAAFGFRPAVALADGLAALYRAYRPGVEA